MENNLMINEDVVVEILCRCPFKDLGRFKCVSKRWCFLISHVCAPRMSYTSPILGLYFRGLALSDHVPGTHLLFSSEHNTLSNDKIMFEYVPLSDLSCANQHPEGEVIDSCGGLLLSVRNSICQYYVCNPLTKQSVEIPKARNHTLSSSTYCGLAFDPCESLHFKIVRFMSSLSEQTWLDIYFSNIGKWVREKLQIEPHVYHPSSVYLKGIMYRLTYSNELMCLDLNTVNMHFSELPKVQNSRGVGSLGVRMGRLSYVKISGSCKTYIWSLEGSSKAGSEWCLKYTFSTLNMHFSELPKVQNSRGVGSLGVRMGWLSYVKISGSCKTYIWSLEGSSKAGSEWCLKYTFSTLNIFKQVMDIYKHPLKGGLWLEPYAFHHNVDMIFFGTPRMIFSYDLCSRSLKKVLKTDDSMRCYHPYLLVSGCLAYFKNEGLPPSASTKIYDLCSRSLKKVFETKDSMRCYHPYLLVPGCLASFKNEGLTQSASSKTFGFHLP